MAGCLLGLLRNPDNLGWLLLLVFSQLSMYATLLSVEQAVEQVQGVSTFLQIGGPWWLISCGWKMMIVGADYSPDPLPGRYVAAHQPGQNLHAYWPYPDEGNSLMRLTNAVMERYGRVLQ